MNVRSWLRSGALVSAMSAVLAPSGIGQVQFVPSQQLSGSDPTEALALGDIDGDGDLDLIFGNLGQNRVYVNDGTGTFTHAPANMPSDSDLTRAVALGDVDGDGDLDLVFGNHAQQNRLYLNDGTGTFTDATSVRMPSDSDFTAALALHDVDGDVDLDLVVGNIGDLNRLYLNDGTGVFSDVTLTQIPPSGASTFHIALGDVDKDGDPDLVLGNSGQNRLYLNDGSGTFTDATAAQMPSVRETTLAVALGDVDGDDVPDLVFLCQARIRHDPSHRSSRAEPGPGTITAVAAAPGQPLPGPERDYPPAQGHHPNLDGPGQAGGHGAGGHLARGPHRLRAGSDREQLRSTGFTPLRLYR